MASNAVATSVPAALIDAAARFDGLVREIRDPQARAIGHWTALETLTHVAVTSTFDALSCRSDVAVPEGFEEVLHGVSDARIADIGRLNAMALERMTDRDLERLADHIAHNVGIMAFAATAEPERTGPWLGGIELPMRTVAAHFLGELLLHGLDIARSQGVAWDIGDEEAHLTFADAYMVILDVGARLLASAAHRPVRAEFRAPSYESVRIDVAPGEITVGPSDGSPADVVFIGRPSTVLQMMFERINPYAAVATGRVKLGGRRPWRVLRFRRQLRMP